MFGTPPSLKWQKRGVLSFQLGFLFGRPISIGLSRPCEASWRSLLPEKQIILLRVHLRAAKACWAVCVFLYLFPAHLRSFLARVTPSVHKCFSEWRTGHLDSAWIFTLSLSHKLLHGVKLTEVTATRGKPCA